MHSETTQADRAEPSGDGLPVEWAEMLERQRAEGPEGAAVKGCGNLASRYDGGPPRHDSRGHGSGGVAGVQDERDHAGRPGDGGDCVPGQEHGVGDRGSVHVPTSVGSCGVVESIAATVPEGGALAKPPPWRQELLANVAGAE